MNSKAARLEAPVVMVDAFLWTHLTAGPAAGKAALEIVTQSEARPEQIGIIHGPALSDSEPAVPAGMFDESVLQSLLETDQHFTGLVVLIEIGRNGGRGPRSESVLQLLTACFAGLLGENDFGCRAANGAFVMICPGEQGAQAQRRLNQVSEQLREFQLRVHGTFSILLSWGGIGVQDGSLSGAIASAVERLHRTKRYCKAISMNSVRRHRKAV